MHLIGNWKQNLTINDLDSWFKEFAGHNDYVPSGRVKVVIASSYVLIHPSIEIIKQLNSNIEVASQDVSEYPSGSHTGEVGVFQLVNLVKYIILGHSERRALGETNEQVARKAKLAIDSGIKPIICFSNLHELSAIKKSDLPINNIMMAYEPVESIGTGKSAPVSDLYEFFQKTGLENMIYGGSVDKDSIHPYLDLDFLSGFLVGGASLDPTIFKNIFETIDKRN